MNFRWGKNFERKKNEEEIPLTAHFLKNGDPKRVLIAKAFNSMHAYSAHLLSVDKNLISEKKRLLERVLNDHLIFGELEGLTTEEDKRNICKHIWSNELEWIEEKRKDQRTKLDPVRMTILSKYEQTVKEEIKKLEGPISGPSNLDRLFKSDDDKNFVLWFMRCEELTNEENKWVGTKTYLKSFIAAIRGKDLINQTFKSEEAVTKVICDFIGCPLPEKTKILSKNKEYHQTHTKILEEYIEVYLSNKQRLKEITQNYTRVHKGKELRKRLQELK